MKKILLLATGGTIASSETEQGLIPTIDAQQMLSYIPELEEVCELSGVSIMNVDSTNMNPKRMAQIAEAIYNKYQEYDGFVVTHGTDTMGYTAAALTYMLQNIKKPVVVTGSQIAIKALNTDAKRNLTDAIRFANEDFPGIFVAFDHKIMYGTYAVKVKTRSIDSFQSINFPTVADIKEGKIFYNSVLNLDEYRNKFKAQELNLQTNLCEDILILKIFPGIKPHIFDYIKEHYKGVIIESFGIGGIPNVDYDIVSKVKELIQADIAVVITTQCLCEGIDLSIYAVGKILAQHDIIYAGNMTTEAATMKLMWALGNRKGISAIKTFMETSF